jgi:hypothetical protein
MNLCVAAQPPHTNSSPKSATPRLALEQTGFKRFPSAVISELELELTFA